jgi:hypothetical protein
VTGAWGTGIPRWRNTAKNHAEGTLWMAQTVASGMVVWYHWLGGQSGMGLDHRWQQPGREFFQWQVRHDAHFTYKRSIANLGVVWSQRSNEFYKLPGAAEGGRGTGYGEYLQGLYYALLEGRFFFDMVHEDDLDLANVNHYSALLLPNIATLSDRQCEQLAAYVQGGGSLLATFETSLYDENGKRRDEFGLAKVLHIRRKGEVAGPLGNSFFAHVETDHEILAGLGGTSLLPGAEYRVPVEATMPGRPVLTVVRPYPGYPPECVYSAEGPTSEPAVVMSESGDSRVIYFPGDIERSAWRSGNTDLSRLLQNSIRWVVRGRAPITVSGEGVVEMFAWETDPGYALHILNYNNPNLFKGWFRQSDPIGAQTVRMQVAGGTRIAKVELLRAEKQVEFQQDATGVEFVIPGVNDYEVAALTRA